MSEDNLLLDTAPEHSAIEEDEEELLHIHEDHQQQEDSEEDSVEIDIDTGFGSVDASAGIAMPLHKSAIGATMMPATKSMMIGDMLPRLPQVPDMIPDNGDYPRVYDIDMDSLTERPWLNPGADITDWFNYGFNEDTWKEYCVRQVNTRIQISRQSKIKVHESHPMIRPGMPMRPMEFGIMHRMAPPPPPVPMREREERRSSSKRSRSPRSRRSRSRSRSRDRRRRSSRSRSPRHRRDRDHRSSKSRK
jgi:hypothetical protein